MKNVPRIRDLPIEEVQSENNTVGSLVRHAMLRLPELAHDESRALLDNFDELDLAECLPITRALVWLRIRMRAQRV